MQHYAASRPFSRYQEYRKVNTLFFSAGPLLQRRRMPLMIISRSCAVRGQERRRRAMESSTL